MPVGGVVYILEQITISQERHIWCFHASTPILSSIPSSTKHWKINVFRYFNIVKNHQNTFKIPSNPSKIRLQSNLIKNHKIFSKNLHKISKKSLYKFPFFLSKIKHFSILTKSKNTFPPNSHIYNVKKSKWRINKCSKNNLFYPKEDLYWENF